MTAAKSQRRQQLHVVMIGYPQTQVLDITGPLEIFSRTSRWLRDHQGLSWDAYTTELVSLDGKAITTSSGLQLAATRRYSAVRTANVVLVAGGIGYPTAMADVGLLGWLRSQADRAERLGSICTGSFVLAKAGLLAGREATTHWAYFDRLLAVEPTVHIDRDAIYVSSGNIYTSAGVTAGMDMALAMVEEDWGKATALAVAQELVMFLKRPGGQSQFSQHLAAQRRDDVFGAVELWILEHLNADLSVDALARRANMSPRHFARMFRARLGITPAAYVRRARVEEVRRQLESGAVRVKRLAQRCGFADDQHMRRAYKNVLGVTPAEYRSRFVKV